MRNYYEIDTFCDERIGRFFQIKVASIYHLFPTAGFEYDGYVYHVYIAPRTDLPITMKQVRLQSNGELKDYEDDYGRGEMPYAFGLDGCKWHGLEDMQAFQFVWGSDGIALGSIGNYGYTEIEFSKLMGSSLSLVIEFNKEKEIIPFNCPITEITIPGGSEEVEEWMDTPREEFDGDRVNSFGIINIMEENQVRYPCL